MLPLWEGLRCFKRWPASSKTAGFFIWMIYYQDLSNLTPKELSSMIKGWEKEGARSITVVLTPEGDITALSPCNRLDTKAILGFVSVCLEGESTH